MAQTEDDNKISKEITIAGQVFILEGTVNFSLTPKGGTVPDPENPPTDPKPDKPSDFGTIKQGDKWSISPGPSKDWIIQKMTNPDTEWKLISPLDQKNVIANLKSEADAAALRKYFETVIFPPKEEGGTVPDTEPEQPPGTGTGGGGGTTGEGPYPAKTGSKTLQSTQRGPTTRHYASGKPDDETIEKNVKSIPFDNYQWVTYTTMHEVEHDDNISVKFGGNHMDGNGWFDCGISFGVGSGGGMQTCLGVEPKHPSTKLCVVKGPKLPGTVIEKKIGVAGVYRKTENHIELWVDTGDGWKKACEGKDVAGLKPNQKSNEAQLRIDGFKKGSVPTIHSAVVQEIMPKA